MKKIKELAMPSMAIIMAIVLAFGTTAFKEKSAFDTTTMYYQGTSFSQTDVQTKSNWSTAAQDCPNGTTKACGVDVPNEILSGGSFISTVTLQATSGNPSALNAVKNSGNPVTVSIHNRPN